MRTRNEAHHAKRRADIVAAAADCFVKAGFHQTGMQDICKAVGMSPGALYRYFPSKQKIIEAMAEQEREENRRWMALVAAAPDIRQGLLELINELAPMLSNRDAGRLTLEVSAEAARNPEVAAIFAENEAEVREGLIFALKEGQTTGAIRRDLDVATAAHLLVGIFDGLIGRAAFPLPVTRSKLIKSLSDLVQRFLAP